MKRTIALVLAVAALVAPGALAQSPVQRINAQERARGHDPRVVGTTPQAAATPVERIIAQERGRPGDSRIFGPSEPAPVQIVQVPGGFDWGDAGIGGAATLALVLLVAGGAALRHESRRQEAHG